MKRKIVSINEELCNGCELCVQACHEGAIQMVDGKAKLLHDKYCDGLGDCLPACPTGAIDIVEREAAEFDEEAVKDLLTSLGREIPKNMQEQETDLKSFSGCPGMAARQLKANSVTALSQWPVQLNLINPSADALKNCNLLIAADCVAFAYANFHNDFMKNKTTVIGCPKLDDNQHYLEKLTHILKINDINSVTVAKMEVPCCNGISMVAQQAIAKSGKTIPYAEVTITVDGKRR